MAFAFMCLIASHTASCWSISISPHEPSLSPSGAELLRNNELPITTAIPHGGSAQSGGAARAPSALGMSLLCEFGRKGKARGSARQCSMAATFKMSVSLISAPEKAAGPGALKSIRLSQRQHHAILLAPSSTAPSPRQEQMKGFCSGCGRETNPCALWSVAAGRGLCSRG